jgi:hypothetical protein
LLIGQFIHVRWAPIVVLISEFGIEGLSALGVFAFEFVLDHDGPALCWCRVCGSDSERDAPSTVCGETPQPLLRIAYGETLLLFFEKMGSGKISSIS